MSNPYVEKLKNLPARFKQVHQDAMKMFGSKKITFKMDKDMLSFVLINGFLLVVLLFLRLFVYGVLNHSSDIGWFSFLAAVGLFWVFLRPSPDEKLSVQGFVSNFDKTVTWHPSKIHKPTTTAEIVEIVRNATNKGRKVKVFGNGSAFNSIGQTKGEVIVLDLYKKVLSVDKGSKTVKVQAGIRFGELAVQLWQNGLSIPSLGWFSLQTVGGALQSSSHASSLKYGSFATRVVEIELITASGDVIVASAKDHPDVFNAARNGLGALGVVSTVTIQCENAFYLKKTSQVAPLNDVSSDLQGRASSNEYFAFWWIPHTNAVRLFIATKADKPAAPANTFAPIQAHIIKTATFLAVSTVLKVSIALTAFVDLFNGTAMTILSKAFPREESVVPSYVALFENFAELLPRWSEMEYFVPIENANAAFKDIQQAVNKGSWKLNVPCRVSFVASDNIWLSESFGRNSCCFSISMFNKPGKWRQFVKKIDGVMKNYEGRPHFSKAHSLTATEFEGMYPRWNDFQEVRKRLDPQGTFLNDYLQSIFPQTQ